MPQAVTDANVIIDLVAGGLLADLFRLPGWAFCVPDIIHENELAPHYHHLPTLGLNVLPQAEDAVDQVLHWRQRYRGPSSHDLFALSLARSLRCPLLTGDGPLRAAAAEEGVEVHGTLWIIEQLLTAGMLTVERAADAYQTMREAGSRLPWQDVDLQLQRWRRVGAGPD